MHLVWQVLDTPAAEWTECDVSHITAKSGVLLKITSEAGFEQRCCSAQDSLKLRLVSFCQLCWVDEHSTRGTNGRFLYIKLLQKAFCSKEYLYVCTHQVQGLLPQISHILFWFGAKIESCSIWLSNKKFARLWRNS